ncbi:MAG: efflux RND transporter periplasmic adaptor subunit [Endomicrobia bacterium]|nr:efflux RND transporter periplasmic adaptor subunit [Endomicrobiia bacterium]MCL2799652.1 efflux RND transporter periplasmic adaptor subunit [Endomicrobiia bacterium]
MEKIKYYFYLIKDNIAHSVSNYRAQSPETFKRIVYIAAICMFLIFSSIVAYMLFFKKKAAEENAAILIQVKTIRVKKQDYTDKYTVMGTIKGATENDLRFEIDGYLAMYNFKEGAKIKQGQIICSLDPKDALTKADYAQSKYKSESSAFLSAKERYKVYEEMFNMKALAESKLHEARFEIQSAESRVKAARSELELAQSNLKKTNLAAPSDGILAEIIIKPGEYVTPQDVVCKFISDHGTNFEVDIPEKDIQKLAVGQKVVVLSDSYPDKEFEGVLNEISPTVNPRTRTFSVKISVNNPEGLLRSGMFARGTIFLKELKNVVLIPSDSIVSLNNVTFLVPVVMPDINPGEGIIQMRPCVTGDKVGDKTIVLEGLSIGELVAAETNGQLSDGIRVKFIESDESEAAPVGY